MLSLKYVVLALAAVAEAGKLYGCAGTCIGKAITATGCSSSNSQCICSSVMFMETIKDCAASDCTEAQTESALSVAEEFCNLIGNDLPQLTHEKRGEHGHGRFRQHWQGHGRPEWESHGRPEWEGHGAPWGQSNDAPATPAAPETPAWNTEVPNWSSDSEGFGQGGQQGGGPPDVGRGPPDFSGAPWEGGRPGEGGPPDFSGAPWEGGAPPPQSTQTSSVSTPAQPAPTQTPPAKHPQPPAPAHSHPGQPTTTTAAPTWTTGPSAPQHTVW